MSTKLTWKYAIYIALALAAIGVIALVWWIFGELVGKIVAGIGGLFALLLGGKKLSPLQQYANAEIEAAKSHETADATYQGEVQAAEQNAADARQDLEAASAKESQATQGELKTANTQEQLGDLVDKEIGKATTDIAAWESLTRPPKGQDGWARVVFVAWLVAIVLVGMLVVSSLAHAAPTAPTDAHKAQVAKLIQALQQCRKGGNALAITLKKERTQHAAALKKCQANREADTKKNTKQKAILAKLPQPPAWPYVVGGIIAGVIAGGALGAALGYYFGAKTKAVTP